MILVGGKNIFYSEDLVDTQVPIETEQEIALDIEIFHADCFLKISYPQRYNENLKNYREGDIWEGVSAHNQ